MDKLLKSMKIGYHQKLKIIDLRCQENRDDYIEYDDDEDSISKFNNFANKFEEVLLVGRVPARCLELM